MAIVRPVVEPPTPMPQYGPDVIYQGRLRVKPYDTAPTGDPAVAGVVAARNRAQRAGDITVDPATLNKFRGYKAAPDPDGDADTEGAGDFDPTIPLVVGGSALTAEMLRRLWRNRPQGPEGIADPDFGGPRSSIRGNRLGGPPRGPTDVGRARRMPPAEDIPYGEFTEVNEPSLTGPPGSAGQPPPKYRTANAQNRLTARDPANMPPSEAMDEDTNALQRQRSENYRQMLKRQAELDKAAKYEAELNAGRTPPPVEEAPAPAPVVREEANMPPSTAKQEAGYAANRAKSAQFESSKAYEVLKARAQAYLHELDVAKAAGKPTPPMPQELATIREAPRAGVNRTVGVANPAAADELGGLMRTIANRIRK